MGRLAKYFLLVKTMSLVLMYLDNYTYVSLV